MERALSLIEKSLPVPAAKLEAELAKKGLTSVGMSIDAVAAGAKLLNRPVRFSVVKVDDGKSFAVRQSKIKTKQKPDQQHGAKRVNKGYLAVRPEQVEIVPAIADQAKKKIYFHGLATAAEIMRLLGRRFPHAVEEQLIVEALKLVDGFNWLDESTGWFTLLGIGKHGLPKAIDKVLSVAPEVTVSELREALARNRRLWKEPPPEKVLLEDCRLMQHAHIDGDTIRSIPPRNWKKILTGVEIKLVSVLKKHGPLMDRGRMEDLCVAAGMNRFSFHAFLSWSPVIAQFGPSVYGLLGARFTKDQQNKMLAVARANRGSRRVLGDHGVTEDGNVWLKYQLSKAASTYAVITIPAALKKIVRGRFKLLTPDGSVIGTLAAKDGRAWGLGAYLRKCKAKFGDQITLTIDLAHHTATMTWEGQGIKAEG
jgi:hypothetical protein